MRRSLSPGSILLVLQGLFARVLLRAQMLDGVSCASIQSMEVEPMMLVTPMCGKRGQARSMIRRYFEERFPKSEQIELYFNGPRCYVRILRVLPATTDD